jgi:hypothetical protein
MTFIYNGILISPAKHMIILIIQDESGTRSKNVRYEHAQSRVNAGGSYATEAEVLLAFIDSKGESAPPQITDSDGDAWKLTKQWSNDRGDFFVYELQ